MMYVKLLMYFLAHGKGSQGVRAGVTAVLSITATDEMVKRCMVRMRVGFRRQETWLPLDCLCESTEGRPELI